MLAALPLRLVAWAVDDALAQITLHVRSTSPKGSGPVCAAVAQRVHSRYGRTLADRPWGTGHVTWQLRVRQFFCDHPACPRQICTARLPEVAAPWARRTVRWAARLTALAVALGGAAGVWRRQQRDIAVSRHTLRRLLRQLPVPSRGTPTVLGVDDVAFHTRQPSGTVRIDLERRPPGARLPAREAAPLAQGRRAHPGVEVITRARSTASADGARHGAPAAPQVADRLHVRQNLGEALEQVCHTPRATLDAVNAARRRQGVPLADGPGATAVPPPLPTGPQKTAQRRARRVACHQPGWALRAQGGPGHALATQLGLGKSPGCRSLRTPTVPERPRRRDRGRRLRTPDKPSRLERWNAGCCEAWRRYGAVQQRGDPGSSATVARYAQRLRQAPGPAPRHRPPRRTLPRVAEPHHQLLTARRAAWLVWRRAEWRDEDEAQPLAQRRAQPPAVAEAIALPQALARLVRQRQGTPRDGWLARVAKSPVVPWQRCATGLTEDYDAIKAGRTLPGSNGPVEGHMTRRKLRKRQMFGRASLTLLQRRFVWAARPGQGRRQHPRALSEGQATPAAASPRMPRRPRWSTTPESLRRVESRGASGRRSQSARGCSRAGCGGLCTMSSPKAAKSRMWAHLQIL